MLAMDFALKGTTCFASETRPFSSDFLEVLQRVTGHLSCSRPALERTSLGLAGLRAVSAPRKQAVAAFGQRSATNRSAVQG